MHRGQARFSQLMQFLPWKAFSPHRRTLPRRAGRGVRKPNSAQQSGSGRADDGHPSWLPVSRERSATRIPEDQGRPDLSDLHGRRA